MTNVPSERGAGKARTSRTYAAVLMVASCSPPSVERAPGRIVVALTVDWEGAYLAQDGLDALDALRSSLHGAPITHFVSSAYFTKSEADPNAPSVLGDAVRSGDEVAVHLHGWRSVAAASKVEPKLSPSFVTGTDKRMPFEDDDGFDIDLDVYDVGELRVLLRTSRQRLEQAVGRVSRSYRAGGYLATPKMLQALRDEGYVVDSSALDHRQLDEALDPAWHDRLRALWPNVTVTTQPFLIGSLIEMPIAAVADYSTTPEIVAVLEAAHAQLRKQPYDDVFVVLAFHLETAGQYLERIRHALDQTKKRRELADSLELTTLASAAARASITLVPGSSQ